MSKLSDPWSARQQRHLAFISYFSTDIRLVSGKSNVVADCLSRAALSNDVLGVDYVAMANVRTEDSNVKAFPTAITDLEIIPFQVHNTPLLCHISIGIPRPLVPCSFQRQVFDIIHNLAHPSRKSTVKLVSQKFVWHGLKNKLTNGPRNVSHANNLKSRHMYTRQRSIYQFQQKDLATCTLTFLDPYLL